MAPTRVAGTNGQWGNLPPRLRDEVLQGMGEQHFGKDYDDLISEYLKILAGDQ